MLDRYCLFLRIPFQFVKIFHFKDETTSKMRKFLDHVRNNSMCNVFVDIYVSLNKISYRKPVSGHINFKKRENEQELQKSSCAILHVMVKSVANLILSKW